jgi:quercetin dioxygenase-like cupin family protein
MPHTSNKREIFRKSTIALAALCAIAASVTNASAGDCPAGKVKTGAMKPGETKPKGLTDKVIASIDLSKKSQALDGQLLRMRRLVIEPGGVVPWHSHAERPALIYVINGSITEFRSTCEVPITHKAGEVTAEFGADLMHWWRNDSGKPVELISADLFKDGVKENHPM